MDHLMDPLQGMMKALGTPNITPALKQTVVDGVTREAAGRSVDQLAQKENEVLIGLLKLREKYFSTPALASKHDNAKSTKQRTVSQANA
jgi:carnitine 3-dehydrogenase